MEVEEACTNGFLLSRCVPWMVATALAVGKILGIPFFVYTVIISSSHHCLCRSGTNELVEEGAAGGTMYLQAAQKTS